MTSEGNYEPRDGTLKQYGGTDLNLAQESAMDRTRIQYGGSVKPTNIDQLMGMSDIDGVLVGGASLQPESFARIANYQAA